MTQPKRPSAHFVTRCPPEAYRLAQADGQRRFTGAAFGYAGCLMSGMARHAEPDAILQTMALSSCDREMRFLRSTRRCRLGNGGCESAHTANAPRSVAENVRLLLITRRRQCHWTQFALTRSP